MHKIKELTDRLLQAPTLEKKLEVLNEESSISSLFSRFAFDPPLSLEKEFVFKQLIAIGQLQRLLSGAFPSRGFWEDLLEKLLKVDFFYREIGGIVGYHSKVLSLLGEKNGSFLSDQEIVYHPPTFIDISEPNPEVQEEIRWGLEGLPQMAEIYPLGGAADRLHLIDETTGLDLPAAKLEFGGRSLFERLIRDLSARESLFFKLYGKQVVTPVAIMTSLEKENHRHVLEIIEKKGWFGRPKSSFRLFSQPLVPVVNEAGEWGISFSKELLMKPGGHGAIWKLARDEGVFSWLKEQKREYLLVRQINNPLAGLDYGLLAFLGIGWKKKMRFGFASCPRLLKAAEGVNVVLEKRCGEKKSVVLTNIEYCDFSKFGIEDVPLKEGEPFSRFSSNTNILFAKLSEIESAIEKTPFPGLLINFKKGAFVDFQGEKKEALLGRLESTMQNIADVFVEEMGSIAVTEETYVTYNHRHKTISTAKKAFSSGSFHETPENCFYDLLEAARELLEKECAFTLPPRRSLACFLEEGPPFVFSYHPALGPLYSIIRQKIQGGSLSLGSEMDLEISELSMQGLFLEGSLQILATQVMGHFDPEGHLCYSDRVGRCVLKNVSVHNAGVVWDVSRPFWKGRWIRKESLTIVLHGRSELLAENVTFKGNHRLEVEDGFRLTVFEREGELVFQKEPLESGPFWEYQWQDGICLKREQR